MNTKQITLLLALTLVAIPSMLFAQTSEYSLRSSVSLEFRIIKGLNLEISPEFRYSPGTALTTCLIQAGLNYKVGSWLSVGGYYRLNGSQVSNTSSLDGPSVDFSNRFAFDARTKIDLNRFTPKFRVRFCNFSDFESQTDDKSDFVRYRLGLDYNIKGIKLSPFVSVEMYQKLSSGLFSKSRYSIGAEYEFSKNNSLSAGYSYDDKFKTLNKYHLFELTYQLRF